MRKVLGYCLVASPFIVLAVLGGITLGWAGITVVFIVTGVICGVVWLGIKLIDS